MRDSIGADEIQRVVQTYQQMLLRIALHAVRDRTDAEDLVQEVFLRWAEKRPSFAEKEHEKAWFIRVAVNVCKNHQRSAWFRHSVPSGNELPPPGREWPPDSLLEEVRRLPPSYRAVIYLHYYEGYALTEIAAILRKKNSTVQTWHQRAKSMLRQLLTEES